MKVDKSAFLLESESDQIPISFEIQMLQISADKFIEKQKKEYQTNLNEEMRRKKMKITHTNKHIFDRT